MLHTAIQYTAIGIISTLLAVEVFTAVHANLATQLASIFAGM